MESSLEARSLGLAEVLRAVRSWPEDQVLALTRELVATLPPEGRAALVAPADPAPKANFADLIGLIPYDGPPLTDEDVDKLREERLWKKYGPW